MQKTISSRGYRFLTSSELGFVRALAEDYGNQAFLRKKRSRPERIRSMAATITQARKILLRIAPLMGSFPVAQSLILSIKKPDELVTARVQVAVGIMEEAEKFLLDSLKPGREAKFLVASCGAFLAGRFKKRVGSPRWEWVGEILVDNFPDGLTPDDGSRDLKLWAHNLVKRYKLMMQDPQRRKRAIEGHVRRDLIGR